LEAPPTLRAGRSHMGSAVAPLEIDEYLEIKYLALGGIGT
jgi:hypothetical protein